MAGRTEPAAATGDTSGGTSAPASAPAPLPHSADSIDLLGTAGAPVLKRALPVIIGLITIVGIIWLIARRKR